MLKKTLIFVLLIAFTSAFTQNSLNGKMKPAKAEYSWVILYQLDGVNQKYIANGTIKDGEFSLEIPKETKPGMYRLLYDNKNNKFIDFIYNNEDITMMFHPDYPMNLVKYDKSEENKVFQKYNDQVSKLYNKLDSIQVVYFQTKNAKHELKLNKLYSKELKSLKEIQNLYNKNSKGKIANHFIVANSRFYSDKLIKNTSDYLNTIKKHYFDYVDFDNPVLLKSSLLIDRIIDYVFYLNTSDNQETLIKLRKEGVVTSLSKINKPSLKKDVIESLLHTFARQEDLVMVDYLLKNQFKELPISLQDHEFKEMILDMIKTTIGVKAPNIVWQDKGKEKSLYNLKEDKYYLIVFWSTTCGHCLKELPVLQKFLKDKPNIQVIAIALENKVSKIGWIDEKYYYEEFEHVLALSSEEDSVYRSKYVTDYGVNATPSFFLLNSDKTIIAKPYDVKELEKIYPTISKGAKKELKKK